MEEELPRVKPNNTLKQKWPRIIMLAELMTLFRQEKGRYSMRREKKEMGGSQVSSEEELEEGLNTNGEQKHLAEKGENRISAKCFVLH